MKTSLIYNAIEKFKTPFYLYDYKEIVNNYKEFYNHICKDNKNIKIFYSIKANFNPHIIGILKNLGCGLETAYDYEYFMLQKYNYLQDHIHNSLVNSEKVLSRIAQSKTKINFDNYNSFLEFDKFCNIPELQPIGFRHNILDLKRKSESFNLSGEDSKLGLIKDELFNSYKRAYRKGYRHFGLLCMQASNVFNASYYSTLLKHLSITIKKLEDTIKTPIEYLDLGGGFGVSVNNDSDINLESLGKSIHAFSEEFPNCKIFLEPGRYLIAKAGYLVTRIITVKERADKIFYIVNGGSNIFVRKAWFNFDHKVEHLTKGSRKKTDNKKSIVVGPLFDNHDILAETYTLPKLHEGDYILIRNVGAYGSVRMSNYGSQPFCSEILYKDNNFFVIRKKQTFDNFCNQFKI